MFGGSSHLDQLKEVGTDLQLISPRPYQMMTSEHPRLVSWFVEETNNIIAKQVQLYPDTFRGVCGLPMTPGVSPKAVLPYLEKCVKEQGFVGLLLNPIRASAAEWRRPRSATASGIRSTRRWWSSTSRDTSTPPAADPIGCRMLLHFINEESIGVVSLLNSEVFKDFPTLKILVSHGGGAIPYQHARFEAVALRGKGARFSEKMRSLYYDTVLYSRDALELLFKTVGVDRCLFGTERPGVGTVKDPRTGRWLDETRFTIEAIEWLSDADKKMIFEDNAKKVFNLKVEKPSHRLIRSHACRPEPRAVRSSPPPAAMLTAPAWLRAQGEDRDQLSDEERGVVAPLPRQRGRLLPEAGPTWTSSSAST